MSTDDNVVASRPTTIRVPKAELPPGSRKVVRAGRREIALFNVRGTVYAIFNRCPHHQAPLDSGPLGGTNVPSAPGTLEYGLDGRVLRCPWHHYEFDLATGRCLADPDRLRVRSYKVVTDGNDLVVRLAR
jgi:nitrite reductase/ring-hydroxylating ferredoxin subunit